MAKLKDKLYNRIIEGELVLDGGDAIGSAVVDSLKGKDVAVKTIGQSEANWSYDITEFPNITGGTASLIFGRIQQINKELHIILVGKIANNTEAQIQAYQTSLIDIDLPESIAEKIYDYLGNKASEGPLVETIISSNYANCMGTPYVDMSTFRNNVNMFVLNKTANNRISVLFARNTNIQIPAGQEVYFESRVSLDLL